MGPSLEPGPGSSWFGFYFSFRAKYDTIIAMVLWKTGNMKYLGAVFLAALAAVIMAVLVHEGRHAPFIPQDIFHSMVINTTACTTCHTPGKQAPLKASHPPKEECMFCHKSKQSR